MRPRRTRAAHSIGRTGGLAGTSAYMAELRVRGVSVCVCCVCVFNIMSTLTVQESATAAGPPAGQTCPLDVRQ